MASNLLLNGGFWGFYGITHLHPFTNFLGHPSRIRERANDQKFLTHELGTTASWLGGKGGSNHLGRQNGERRQANSLEPKILSHDRKFTMVVQNLSFLDLIYLRCWEKLE